MYCLIITIAFVNLVLYYSSKRDAKYKEGMLFLVTLPDYALNSIDIHQITAHYNKHIKLVLIGNFISSAILFLLADLLSSLLFTFILVLLIFINIIVLQIPFKVARNKLPALKKQNNWLITSNKTYKVDIKLSSLMEQHILLVMMIIGK